MLCTPRGNRQQWAGQTLAPPPPTILPQHDEGARGRNGPRADGAVGVKSRNVQTGPFSVNLFFNWPMNSCFILHSCIDTGSIALPRGDTRTRRRQGERGGGSQGGSSSRANPPDQGAGCVPMPRAPVTRPSAEAGPRRTPPRRRWVRPRPRRRTGCSCTPRWRPSRARRRPSGRGPGG